jgi:hypothetical protein
MARTSPLVVGRLPTWKAVTGAVIVMETASMDDRPLDRQESRERRPSRPRQAAGEGMVSGWGVGGEGGGRGREMNLDRPRRPRAPPLALARVAHTPPPRAPRPRPAAQSHTHTHT